MNQTSTRTSGAGKPQDPMLGRVVAGRYRLEARAGEGGMGVVYRARHVLIDRVVALKLIRPDLRGETHLRAWMLREARAANRVDHAHIIDIHDIGETEEGELYLVMEYRVGTALSSELARGPMPLARSVDRDLRNVKPAGMQIRSLQLGPALAAFLLFSGALCIAADPASTCRRRRY